MNILIATGNIGGNAKQRVTTSGHSVVSFSIPVKSGFGKNQIITWVKCDMFGKHGEAVLPYLLKGQLVAISGEFSISGWEDKQGKAISTPRVDVKTLDLLGKVGKYQVSSEPDGGQGNISDEDDIPF
jgi:single-strand DNA-binding protein